MLESIWGTEISLSICVLNMGSNAPYCWGPMPHIAGEQISLSICVLNMGSNAPYCSGNGAL